MSKTPEIDFLRYIDLPRGEREAIKNREAAEVRKVARRLFGPATSVVQDTSSLNEVAVRTPEYETIPATTGRVHGNVHGSGTGVVAASDRYVATRNEVDGGLLAWIYEAATSRWTRSTES